MQSTLPTSNHKIKYGIIAIGEHSLKMIPHFFHLTNSELVAISTNSQNKISVFNKRFPKLKFFNSYQDLITSDFIDAVYICSPNHLHFEHSKSSLENNKHVLSEKPLCKYLSEAEKLENLALKNNLQIKEGFMYRFHPQHLKVKDLIQNHFIGEIREINARYHYQLNDSNNIRLKNATWGGALSDAGCYLIDLCLFLLDNIFPEKINHSSIMSPELKIDLTSNINLIFPNNIQANLSCSMEMPRENSYEILGTSGSIKARNAFHVLENQLTSIEIKSKNSKSEIIKFPAFNQFAKQFESFSDSILEKRNLDSSFKLNAKIIESIN